MFPFHISKQMTYLHNDYTFPYIFFWDHLKCLESFVIILAKSYKTQNISGCKIYYQRPLRGFSSKQNLNNLIKKFVRDKTYRCVYKKIAHVDRYLQYNQNAIRCLFFMLLKVLKKVRRFLKVLHFGNSQGMPLKLSYARSAISVTENISVVKEIHVMCCEAELLK